MVKSPVLWAHDEDHGSQPQPQDQDEWKAVEPVEHVVARGKRLVNWAEDYIRSSFAPEEECRPQIEPENSPTATSCPVDIILVSHGDTLQILQTYFQGIDPHRHRTLPHLETCTFRLLN